MNTSLTASQDQPSKHLSRPAVSGTDHLAVEFPREDELRRLSLADRLALRVALWLVLHARRDADPAEQHRRHEARLRVLAEYEHRRLHAARSPQLF